MTETTQRILNLMKNNGDNAHSLEMKANLPISSIAGWKKDKFQPSTDSIIKLARYFGVSTDYLLGLSEEPTPLKQSSSAEYSADLMLEIIPLSKDKEFYEVSYEQLQEISEKRARAEERRAERAFYDMSGSAIYACMNTCFRYFL